ncbi:MAG: hypothetical protein KGO96_10510 [Elusimicrobia bacterium]|nr:hypothetical protein [Elusimicrobiota bacterium]
MTEIILGRRAVLFTGATGVLAAVLTACSGTTPSPTAPAWVSIAQSIAAGLGAAVPGLEGVGLSTTTGGEITTAANSIARLLAQLPAVPTAAQGQSIVTTIENDINTFAPLITPFAALIPGGATIGLVVAALPALEAAVNLATSLTSTALSLATTATPKTAGGARGAHGPAPQLSPQAALVLLRQRLGQ